MASNIKEPQVDISDTNNNAIEAVLTQEIQSLCNTPEFSVLLADQNKSAATCTEEPNIGDKVGVNLQISFTENLLYETESTTPLPSTYYKFQEKSSREQESEIEYDLDEVDIAWLSIINEHRSNNNLAKIADDHLETTLDRLEKISFAWMQSKKVEKEEFNEDEDEPCCICLDDECSNTNAILFCDKCDMAVHQDCYGVPYIPEGQWFCRRCIHSPNEKLKCCLCPNFGGAFKQTDDGRWAHVICALIIPEVRFANVSFLEPIDCLERIPQDRYELYCRVCRRKNVGACIQCDQNYCISTFHVTCALIAGLNITILPSSEAEQTAFCDICTTAKEGQLNVDSNVIKIYGNANTKTNRSSDKDNQYDFIPDNAVAKLKEQMKLDFRIEDVDHILARIYAYWILKRQSRNGASLIRNCS